MTNIFDILKKQGLEISEEKKKDFEKEFYGNYKTIKEFSNIQAKLDESTKAKDNLIAKYDGDLKSRDNDLKNLQKQLEEAGADSSKLAELTDKFSSLEEKYKNAQANYEKELESQKRGFAIKELANGIKFTSNSAKELFVQKLTNDSEYSLKDGEILGFDKFVEKYKESDANAFAVEGTEPQQSSMPIITSKSNKLDNPKPSAERVVPKLI